MGTVIKREIEKRSRQSFVLKNIWENETFNHCRFFAFRSKQKHSTWSALKDSSLPKRLGARVSFTNSASKYKGWSKRTNEQHRADVPRPSNKLVLQSSRSHASERLPRISRWTHGLCNNSEQDDRPCFWRLRAVHRYRRQSGRAPMEIAGWSKYRRGLLNSLFYIQ